MNFANYTIKNLVLFEDLRFSLQESSNITKLEYLYRYENKVSPKSQNPDVKMFLTDEEFLGYGFYGEKSENQSEHQLEENCNVIPKGKYLFIIETPTGDFIQLHINERYIGYNNMSQETYSVLSVTVSSAVTNGYLKVSADESWKITIEAVGN